MTKPRPLFALLAVLMLAVACSSPSTRHSSSQPATPDPAPAQAQRARSTRAATPAFDFYLLNLSWSPEYCKTHPSANECAVHAAFVLHGLWPENADGTYQTKCSSAPGPADPSQYKDIYPDAGLLKHEWSAHGTCSGLGPDAFFTAARKAFHSIVIPPKLAGLPSEATMKPSDILGLFTASNAGVSRSGLAMTCPGNELTAVEVCLDKSLKPIACGPIRSCRAPSVQVQAP